MDWTFSIYAAPLFLSAGILAGLLLIAWQRRQTAAAWPFMALCMAIILYQVGYALELGSQSLSQVRFWLTVQYVGITLGPVFLLLFIMSLTQQESFLPGRSRWLLAVIPGVSIALAAASTQHELLWQDMRLDLDGDFTATLFERGLWNWVQLGYYFSLIVVALLLLLRAWRGSLRFRSAQAAMLTLATLLPIFVTTLYILEVTPPGLDTNPYSLFFTAILLAGALLYGELLNVLPMARAMVLANLSDAFIVLDNQNRVVDLNPSAQRLLRVDLSTSLGQSYQTFFAPWSEMVQRYSESNYAEFEAEVEGRQYFLEFRQHRLLDERGQGQGRVIVLRDITQRKELQTALETSNENLTMLRRADNELNRKLSVQYVLQIGLDVVLRWTHAEAVAIALLSDDGKLRVAEAQGDYSAQKGLLFPADSGIIGRVVKKGKPEMILDVAQDPDYIPMLPQTRAQMTLPLLSGNQLIGIMNLETEQPEYFTSDIFEMLTLLAGRLAVAIDNARGYEERELLVAELEAFAFTVAHDLKNPLSVIEGFCDLMLDDWARLDDTKKQDYIRKVKKSAVLSTDIINALLLLARVRAEAEVPMETLEMGELVNKIILDRLDMTIKEHRAVITQPERWQRAIGYAPWVNEIWANYLSNAIKYGGEPPHITLGSDLLPDGQVRFWVKDNGNGLTPEQQAKLFTPFSRLSEHTKVEGHGLGLSIVQRIAEKLKGTVGLESAPGEGSLFYFTLPVGDSK